ncbi:hypothetical protein [Pedococcus sp. 5OH_020]|uniref:hypothetical protein n=1 Tax=Pedococcus sp. 5OH_020 TaxID=2989814 RepID=UPI0022E9DB7F|nr:hypothetical protein [Pedococcus sp. 5OH_020]
MRLRVPPRVAAAVAAALLAAGCTGGGHSGDVSLATSRGTSPAVSSTAGSTPGAQNAPDPTVLREEALTTLLNRRAAAVLSRDRRAFVATLDSTTTGFGLRQLAQFEALSQLPLAQFSYGTPEPAPALSAERIAQVGPDAWVSRVRGRYSLAGFDSAPDEFESYLTVVRRGSRWKLADDADGGNQPQLWDLPRFTVLQSATTLVVGSGPQSRLRPYLALGDLAVKRVRSVWTEPWRAKLVLVVPASAAQMAEQVGQDPGSVKQVAAVTDGPFDARGRAVADRVVVNPGAFASLQQRGRQVVVTHEATHVAVRASTNGPVPLWLSEGMADFVGYRDIGATRSQIAAALLDRVRAGHGPTALPAEADFDPSRTTIAPSYNAAWLAVNRIADRYGRAALVRLYLQIADAPRQPGGRQDPDAATRAAFRSVLHTSQASFTREWLAYLKALASGS